MEPAYSAVNEQELTTFPSEQTREYLDSIHRPSRGSYSTLYESYDTETATPPVPDGITRNSPGDTSQNNGALVVTNHPHQNGISIFQGYCFSTY